MDRKISPVVCKLCGKKFKKITNTHLEKEHNTTPEQYKKKFPNSKMISNELKHIYQKHKRGKTYEQMYGNLKAKQIKNSKSEKLKVYDLEKRKCKICEKIFIVKENSSQQYCSVVCKFEGQRKEKVLSNCLICKKEIISYANSPKIFCSQECSNEHRKKVSKIKIPCATCGKIVDKKLNSMTYNKNIFCSDVCKKKYNNINRKKDYRTKAYEVYGKICKRCNSTKNLVVHHIDGNRLNNDINNLCVFCKKCHKHEHDDKSQLHRQFVGEAKIEQGMISILEGLQAAFNLDIYNENFRLTPKRVARAYYEIFKGVNAKTELKNIAETSFPSEYTGMVSIADIQTFSMCPHHFLPVEYKVTVAYIPKEKTVGLSKLSRIVDLLAKQPELQEMFTQQIANILENELCPLGVAVHVQGRHMCMVMRGIKKDSWTTTSVLTGPFKHDEKARAEFMSQIK